MFIRYGVLGLELLRQELDAPGRKHPHRFIVRSFVHGMLECLSTRSQRLTKSQAEIGELVGMSPTDVSRAVKVLRELGVLILPERLGRSLSYEVDAAFATCMSEPDRQAAQKSQRERLRAQVDAAKVVKFDPSKMRELPWQSGRVDDPNQPELV